MTKPTILITGCSSGIGLACAQGMLARGWRVFATIRKMEDAAPLVGAEILLLEQTDSASVQACAAEVLQRTGGQLDALFCNAGLGVPGAVEDLSRDVGAMRGETLYENLISCC